MLFVRCPKYYEVCITIKWQLQFKGNRDVEIVATRWLKTEDADREEEGIEKPVPRLDKVSELWRGLCGNVVEQHCS